MRTISLCFLTATIICSCDTRGQNPTTEQMIARADSIDSVIGLRQMEVQAEEAQRLRDSAEMMAEERLQQFKQIQALRLTASNPASQ